MLLKSLRINRMLSFRDVDLDLRPLNVLIGPNASGKSNLIEIIALLQSTSRDLAGFVRQSGGITDWLWKGSSSENGLGVNGRIEAILNVPQFPQQFPQPLRYVMEIAESAQRLEIVEEVLENERPDPGHSDPYHYFQIREGRGMIRAPDEDNAARIRTRPISADDLSAGQSVLHELRDPTLNREISRVRRQFDAIRLYREWNMGRKSSIRNPQQTDAANAFLQEDFSNLVLVLNQLQSTSAISKIERSLAQFYDAYEQVGVGIHANTAQLWIREKGLENAIPATRLSDGTLRFLALLVILCHPEPPPLVCIEEPELGLHPDVIPLIAELLTSAAQRTQIVVTTHSKALIDELSDDPESVVVCERTPDFGSKFERLSEADLELWLERYQLGELWQKGQIGGTRW